MQIDHRLAEVKGVELSVTRCYDITCLCRLHGYESIDLVQR